MQWRLVELSNGRLEVNEVGGVRSLKSLTHPGKILNQQISNSGYRCFAYRTDGKRLRLLLTHRLVAKAFIPNPDNKPQVNHKDGNKLNNNVSNLEWCTQSENGKHAHDNNLIKVIHGEEHPWAKLSQEQAQEIKDKYQTGKYTQRQLAQEYGVIQQTISRIMTGLNWKRSLS